MDSLFGHLVNITRPILHFSYAVLSASLWPVQPGHDTTEHLAPQVQMTCLVKSDGSDLSLWQWCLRVIAPCIITLLKVFDRNDSGQICKITVCLYKTIIIVIFLKVFDHNNWDQICKQTAFLCFLPLMLLSRGWNHFAMVVVCSWVFFYSKTKKFKRCKTALSVFSSLWFLAGCWRKRTWPSLRRCGVLGFLNLCWCCWLGVGCLVRQVAESDGGSSPV